MVSVITRTPLASVAASTSCTGFLDEDMLDGMELPLPL
jgi:hypothetical protein